jgi:hypothetical protein
MAHVRLVTVGAGDVEQATRYDDAVGWRRSSLSVDDTISSPRAAPSTVVLGLSGRDDLAPTPPTSPPTGTRRPRWR